MKSLGPVNEESYLHGLMTKILPIQAHVFILSARPQGYRDAPLQRANVLEVQPFNSDQVRKFIENWYLCQTKSKVRAIN